MRNVATLHGAHGADEQREPGRCHDELVGSNTLENGERSDLVSGEPDRDAYLADGEERLGTDAHACAERREGAAFWA